MCNTPSIDVALVADTPILNRFNIRAQRREDAEQV